MSNRPEQDHQPDGSQPSPEEIGRLLRDHPALFQKLLDAIPNPVFYKNADLVYLGCNQAFADYVGIPRQQVIGSTLEEVWDARQADRYRRMDRQLLEQRTSQRYEHRLQGADGRIRYVVFDKAIFTDPNGKPAGLVGIITDITSRKKLEDFLEIQRDLAVKLAGFSSLDESLQAITDAAMRIEGVDAAGVYVTSDDDGLELACHAGLSSEFARAMRTFPPDSPQVELVQRGQPVYAPYAEVAKEISAVPLHDGLRAMAILPLVYGGRTRACLNLASRSTDEFTHETRQTLESVVSQLGQVIARSQAYSRLEESEHRYRILFETSPAGVIVTDTRGTVLHANQRAATMLGQPAFDLVGSSASRFAVHPERLMELIERVQEEETIRDVDAVARRADGQIIDLLLSASSLTWNDAPAILTILEDITQRRRAETELQDHRNRLEELVQQRTSDLQETTRKLREEVRQRSKAEGELRRSEQRLRAILSSTPDVIFILSAEGRYLDIFTARPELLAAPTDQLLSRTIHEILPAEVAQPCQAVIDAAMDSRQVQRIDYEVVLPSGDTRWFAASVATADTDEGEGVIWVARDVTERKQAEQALQEAERRFTEALKTSRNVLYRFNVKQDRYDYVSDYIEKISGQSVETWLGKSMEDSLAEIHPDDLPGTQRAVEQAVAEASDRNASVVLEYRRRVADGRYVWVSDWATVLLDEQGRMESIVGAAYDVTEKKLAEQQLRAARDELEQRVRQRTAELARSEAQWRSLVRTAPGIICRMDLNGKILYANQNPPGVPYDIVGTFAFDYLSDDLKATLRQRIEHAVRTGQPETLEFPYMGEENQTRWYSARFGPVHDGECVAGLTGIATDITDLKEAERRIRQERDHSAQIIKRTPAIICGIAPDGRTTFLNPAGQMATGYRESEIVGVNWWKKMYPGEYYKQVDDLFDAFRQGEVRDYEMTLVACDGSQRIISWNSISRYDEDGELLEIVGFGVDVTRRRQAEQELQRVHAQLMTAQETERRRLAAELHDSVSQQLFALQLQAKRLISSASDPKIRESIDAIADQCNNVIRETRAVSRGLYPSTLLSMGLDPALRQLGSEFDGETRCHTSTSENVRELRFPGEVEIALFRIAQEAIGNAIRHGKARNVYLLLDYRPDRLLLRIEDDGLGFDVANGHGTGLGLSTMSERAKSIDAELSITSQPGETVLTVFLSVAPQTGNSSCNP